MVLLQKTGPCTETEREFYTFLAFTEHNVHHPTTHHPWVKYKYKYKFISEGEEQRQSEREERERKVVLSFILFFFFFCLAATGPWSGLCCIMSTTFP